MLPMHKSSAMRAPTPIEETGFGAGPAKRHVEISAEQEARLTTEEISEGIKQAREAADAPTLDLNAFE